MDNEELPLAARAPGDAEAIRQEVRRARRERRRELVRSARRTGTSLPKFDITPILTDPDADLPEGVTVVHRASPPRSAKAASDYAFDGDRWQRLDEPGLNLEGRFEYPVDDGALIPEVVLAVEDATLGTWGDVITGRGVALSSREFQSSGRSRELSGGVLAEFSGTYGSIIFPTANYGHWILQRLPRLHSILSAAPAAKIVNLEWGDAFIFDHYGVPRGDVVSIRRGPAPTTGVRVERLLIATHLAMPGHKRAIDAERLDRLAARFTRGISARSDLPRMLYLARNEVRTARLGALNTEEIRVSLERRGFTTIFPAELPLATQLEYLMSADVMITEVGSGGLNSMFVPAGKTVMVMTPDRSGQDSKVSPFDPTWKTWQRAVCEARGQHFAQMVVTRGRSKNEWEVDIPTLETALDSYPLRVW